jgi:Rrf2 family protein
MKISTKGRYALSIMADLAMNDRGTFISLKDVAKRQDITIKYLEQIIPMLNNAGYVYSSRGKKGGHRLAKRPNEITVGDILRAAEGDLAPVACLSDGLNICPMKGNCLTLPVWQGLYAVINSYVDGITLERMIEQYNERAADNYCI